jgi:hypothetical protein
MKYLAADCDCDAGKYGFPEKSKQYELLEMGLTFGGLQTPKTMFLATNEILLFVI